MNLLTYSLAAILAYLGLFLGLLLAIIAKEEMKQGKKYFLMLQKLILLLLFLFLLIYLRLSNILTVIILLAILIPILRTEKRINTSPYIYMILGVAIYLSSKIPDLFIIESSLVFIYGLPTGSLLAEKSKKKSIINLLKNIGLIITAVSFFLFF